MLNEKSAGVIVYRQNQDEFQYLLLYMHKDYWNFPKGHIEEGESEGEAAIRELREETGINNVKLIEGWRQQTQFIYKEVNREKPTMIRKDLVLYLAQADENSKIELMKNADDGERINGYAWMSFAYAHKYLKFKNLREILTEANSFLTNQNS